MIQVPDLCCIICTYNRAEYLADTLHYLFQNRYSGAIEILVVDNNSTDSTREIIRSAASESNESLSVRYVSESNQGLSYARNRGIRESTAPLLLFLDDDIRVEHDFLKSWLQFFKTHPKTEAAGGRIEVQFDDPCPRWMSKYLMPLLGYHHHGTDIKSYSDKSYPFGGNMAIRSDVFDRFGLFDTNLGRVGKKLTASEEKDLFHRLKQGGVVPIYVPDAVIWHRVNAKRLTKSYIRRQAVGLGQSLAAQVHQLGEAERIVPLTKEGAKWVASLILFLFYSATFRFSKGLMLLRFRKWIAEGFFIYSPKNNT